MGIGSALKVPGFGFVYHSLLKPLGWMKPDILDDNPEPHCFAQFVGFLFMTAGFLSLFLGLNLLGWTLVWTVAALAALNVFGGFCVGCVLLAGADAYPRLWQTAAGRRLPWREAACGRKNMSAELLLRFLLAAGIIAAGVFLYWLFNRRLLARVNLSAMADAPRGKPVLVYFTAPTCAPCKTIQRHAINQSVQTLGENLYVLEIDAAARPELAKTWGVMSVPTIFLLDSRGVARYVNRGVTRAEKLMEQIQTLQT